MPRRSSSQFVSFARVSLSAMGILIAGVTVAGAQTTITLPDTNQTTTLTATVGDQARVTVPAGVSFTVSDISSAPSDPAYRHGLEHRAGHRLQAAADVSAGGNPGVRAACRRRGVLGGG